MLPVQITNDLTPYIRYLRHDCVPRCLSRIRLRAYVKHVRNEISSERTHSWVAGAMAVGKPDDMDSANRYGPIQDTRDRTSAPAGTGLRHEPTFQAAMMQGRLNT